MYCRQLKMFWKIYKYKSFESDKLGLKPGCKEIEATQEGRGKTASFLLPENSFRPFFSN